MEAALLNVTTLGLPIWFNFVLPEFPPPLNLIPVLQGPLYVGIFQLALNFVREPRQAVVRWVIILDETYEKRGYNLIKFHQNY